MFKKILLLTATMMMTFGLSACASIKGQTEYVDHTTEETYSFVNMSKNTAEMDAGFTIDGVIDEEAYGQVRPLLLNKKYGTEEGTLDFIAYLGEKGVYIGATVYDSVGVYYNMVRHTPQNSGVEFYIATKDVGTDRVGSFEIDMTAGGVLKFKCRAAEKWIEQRFPYDKAPIYAVQSIGSLVNGECKNYTCELFLPYETLGLTEKPEELYMNPCMITKYSAEAEDSSDRCHYNFAGKQLVYGVGYSVYPDCMYRFDEKGVTAYNLGIDVEGDGVVEEEFGNTCIAIGDEVKIVVEPYTNTRVQSFKVNNQECVDELVTNADGETYYIYDYVDSDVYVNAVFESVPTEQHAVTGKVKYTGGGTEVYKDLSLRMYGQGKMYEVSYDASTRSYSAAVPAGTYYLEVASKSGNYVATTERVTIAGKKTLPTVTFSSLEYGATRKVDFDTTKVMKYRKTIYEGTQSADDFVYMGFLGCAEEITEGKFVTDTLFTYVKEDKTQSFYLQYIVSGDTHSVKLMSRGVVKADKKVKLSAAQRKFAQKRGGVGLILEKEGTTFNVYLENADGTYTNIIEDYKIKKILTGTDVALTMIRARATDDASYQQPGILRSASIYMNQSDHTVCTKRSTYTLDNADSLVGVNNFVLSKDTSAASFSVAAKKSNLFLQVRNNGTVLEAENGRYTFNTLLYNKLEVISFTKKTIGVTIDTGTQFRANGLRIYAVNQETGKEVQGQVSGTQVKLGNIQNGAWDIYGKIFGTRVLVDSLVMENTGTYNLDLSKAFTSASNITKGKVVYDFATCSAYYPSDSMTLIQLKVPVNIEGPFAITAKYKISEADLRDEFNDKQLVNFGIYFSGKDETETTLNDGLSFYMQINGDMFLRNSKYDTGKWSYIRKQFGQLSTDGWKYQTEYGKALVSDGLWVRYERTEDGTMKVYMGTTKDNLTYVADMGSYKNVVDVSEIRVQFNYESENEEGVASDGYAASIENMEITIMD